MTAQVGETLQIEGKSYQMFSEPLRVWFTLSGSPSPFLASSTDCWRGYIGTWELSSGRLYLIGLKGKLPDDERVSIESIFSGWPNRVFAHWYTGVLTVPLGDLLHYEHFGYERLHEETLSIGIERGVVTRQQHMKNIKPSPGRGACIGIPIELTRRPGK